MASDSLSKKISQRKNLGNYRQLIHSENLIDFSSNDYLGLASNSELSENISTSFQELPHPKNGATGSRLISGNLPIYDIVERQLSDVFKSESALIFNSGYHANQALLSAVPQKGENIIYDELSHVCIKEGARLSKASFYSFKHNDLDDLRGKLDLLRGPSYVVTESVFSMDGDTAPLKEMLSLCKEFDAKVVVDEAHSTGVYGANGGGYLLDQQLQDDVFARVMTFGKAIGCHGACIAGSNQLIDFLINFAHPFIYSTALPPHSLVAISESFKFIVDHPELSRELSEGISEFRTKSHQLGLESISDTAIQPIIVPNNEKCRAISRRLRNEGYYAKEILSPTVKKGTERLRISLHSFNTKGEIHNLLKLISEELGIG